MLTAIRTLFALQLFQALFIALHDWIPMGSFNDVKATRAENPGSKLLISTLISTAPFAVLLVESAKHLDASFPSDLRTWLWVAYGLLFVGELNAWWIPYLVRPQPERAERYRKMFGRTRAFLPERNGIRPNTLHAILHAATLATLVLLMILTLHHG